MGSRGSKVQGKDGGQRARSLAEEGMIVHKFGGTLLGDAQCFSNVADIVVAYQDRAENPGTAGTVVVVSAMCGVTEQLIAGARAAAEGKDSVYREIKAGLLNRHLEVVEILLTRSRERLDVGGLVEDRLTSWSGSIAVLPCLGN
jgi:aspartokinase